MANLNYIPDLENPHVYIWARDSKTGFTDIHVWSERDDSSGKSINDQSIYARSNSDRVLKHLAIAITAYENDGLRVVYEPPRKIGKSSLFTRSSFRPLSLEERTKLRKFQHVPALKLVC